jgi:hypothetical protein
MKNIDTNKEDKNKSKYEEKIKIKTNFNDTLRALLNNRPEKNVKK